MYKIATLGPTGTFSELATKKFIAKTSEKMDIMFFSTITKVFKAIGNECDLGIVPIENTLDGYVQVVLDLLAKTELHIINELVIPIQFSLVGNDLDMSNIKTVYAQFKAQGQCYNFLEKFNSVNIITTESNMESFDKLKEGSMAESAIIPKHILNTQNTFPFSIKNITDSQDNQTRFIVLSKKAAIPNLKEHYKTSIIIMNSIDNKPGMLSEILNEFAIRNINLLSIISRPTKESLGKYFFFIDIEGNYVVDDNIVQAIKIIKKKNIVKFLGSFILV